jgi:hypothetical protein
MAGAIVASGIVMKKKDLKTLLLSTEVVRILADGELRTVVGGGKPCPRSIVKVSFETC